MPACDPLPDQTAVATSNAWTDSFLNVQCYDTLKVNSVLNEIDGKKHDGSGRAPVPNIMGMNFQTVSVGQKLIEKTLTPTDTGGYVDGDGTPTAALLNEIQFTDAEIGKMVAHLKHNGLIDSTLIIITAKHGQSPIDSARYTGITTHPARLPLRLPPYWITAAACLSRKLPPTPPASGQPKMTSPWTG